MRGLVQKPMLGDECMSDGTNPGDRNNVLKTLLNEGSGNIISDLSGNGNNGTFAGSPIWVSGKFGLAIDFEAGDSDYITCGDKDLFSFNPNQPFSIVISVNAESVHQGGIVSKSDIPSPGEYYIFNNNGNLIFRIVSGGNRIGVAKSDGISVDAPTHIIATYDGSAAWTGLKLYLYGQDSGATESSSGAYTVMDNTAYELYFGRVETFYWDGTIDYVMIFNRALSASEIALLYREPFCDLGPRRFLPFAPVAAGGISMPLVMQQMNHFKGGMAA